VSCNQNVSRFSYKSSKVPIKIDTQNGILQVLRQKMYYIQVKENGQFYKDGFTDVNGFFDYYNVSNKQVQQNTEFQLIIVAEDGECDVVVGVQGGVQSKMDILNSNKYIV
jgi:hypothetical protein